MMHWNLLLIKEKSSMCASMKSVGAA
uniref:Uncharacterized protein n=1 Tax=Anguilla anguilla TaxID=7936 RepID=A0A0E9SQS2_ANGAN